MRAFLQPFQSQIALPTRNTAWAVPIYSGGAQNVLRLKAQGYASN